MKLTDYPKVYAAIGKAFISVVIVSFILFIVGAIDKSQMGGCVILAFSLGGLAILGVGAMHEDARRRELRKQGKDPFDEED